MARGISETNFVRGFIFCIAAELGSGLLIVFYIKLGLASALEKSNQ